MTARLAPPLLPAQPITAPPGFVLHPKDVPDRLHCLSCLRERYVPRKERSQSGFDRHARLHTVEFCR